MTKEDEENKVAQELAYDVTGADTLTPHIQIKEGHTLNGIVMSDLHLSPQQIDQAGHIIRPEHSDNYRTDAELATRFKKALAAGKVIFLNGDIVEGWQRDKKYFAEDAKKLHDSVDFSQYNTLKEKIAALKQKFLDWHQDLEQEIEVNVRKAFPETFKLIDKYRNNRIFYIKGNHDSNIGVLNSVTIASDKYSGQISHGHEHDESNEDGSILGPIITSIGALFEQYISRNIDEIFNSLTGSHTEDTMAHIKEGNIRLARQHNHQFIITGHTHHGLLETVALGNHKNFLNANCGQGIYLQDCHEEIAFTVAPNGVKAQYQQYNNKTSDSPITIMEQARCFSSGPWAIDRNIGRKTEEYRPPTITNGFNLFRRKKPRKKSTHVVAALEMTH